MREFILEEVITEDSLMEIIRANNRASQILEEGQLLRKSRPSGVSLHTHERCARRYLQAILSELQDSQRVDEPDVEIVPRSRRGNRICADILIKQ